MTSMANTLPSSRLRPSSNRFWTLFGPCRDRSRKAQSNREGIIFATRHSEPEQLPMAFPEGAPRAYRRGDAVHQRVRLRASAVSAVGSLASISTFLVIDRSRIGLSLEKDMRKDAEDAVYKEWMFRSNEVHNSYCGKHHILMR